MLKRILKVCYLLASLLCVAVAERPGRISAQTVGGQRLNKVIEFLEKKQQPPLGIFSFNLSARTGASIASAPLDFVIVDLEHTPYDPSRLESYLLGMIDKKHISAKDTLQPLVTPIIRLPANGREHVEYMIKQVLDLGAFGVVVPHVRNRGDALAAVRAMRYPQAESARDITPEGHRGVGYGWAARYWGLSGTDYVTKADVWPLDPDGELLLWCMVESREGVEHAEEIASTPGVSGIFLGPSDLATSLGVGEDHQKVEEATHRVLNACKKAGIACGTLVSGQAVATRLKQGFGFLAVGSDSGISAGVQRSLEIGRKQ
jgi:4-hydroxy-2-oxoheptanedioate aldolase